MPVAAQTLSPPSRTLMFLEGRAISELGAFLGALPLLSLAPRGDGHPVLVLPGLVASDTSTRPLRSFLKSKGYAVSGWRQGRNLGLRHGVQHAMVDLVQELNDTDGERPQRRGRGPPVRRIAGRRAAGADHRRVQPHRRHLRLGRLSGTDVRDVREHRGRKQPLRHGPSSAAVFAVADRLAQPEGKWSPFDRSGWRSLAYPDPHR